MPILTRLLTIPWEKSPFQAQVYFIGKQTFLDQKWGTRQPITVRDKDFGIVRLRANGKFAFRVADSREAARRARRHARQIHDRRGHVVSQRPDRLPADRPAGHARRRACSTCRPSSTRSAAAPRARSARTSASTAWSWSSSSSTPSRRPKKCRRRSTPAARWGPSATCRPTPSIKPPTACGKHGRAERRGRRCRRDGHGHGGRLRHDAARHDPKRHAERRAREPEPVPATAVSRPPPRQGRGRMDFGGLAPVAPPPPADPKQLVRSVAQSAGWQCLEAGDAWQIVVPVGSLRKQTVIVRFDQKDSEAAIRSSPTRPSAAPARPKTRCSS